MKGEIIALETALASAFGELAVLRASFKGGGPAEALAAMEEMAAQLEASLLRGVVGAEEAGRPGAALGFERRMELIVHALRNAIAFRSTWRRLGLAARGPDRLSAARSAPAGAVPRWALQPAGGNHGRRRHRRHQQGRPRHHPHHPRHAPA